MPPDPSSNPSSSPRLWRSVLPPPPPNKSNLATALRGVEGRATVKAEVEEDDEKCNTDSDLDDPTADSDDDNLMFLRAVSTRRGRMVRFIYQE